MMGTNHAITGATAWVGLTATGAGLGLLDVDAAAVFTGAIICAGAALLPDADHPNSTIAHSVPVVGQAATSLVSAAAGGHRKGLHSLLAVIGIALLAVGLDFIRIDTEWFGQLPIGVGVAAMALTAFGVKALKLVRGSWLKPWLIGVVVAALVVFTSANTGYWLPVCITLGFLVHLLGDALTVGGVAWFWPWRPKPPKLLGAIPGVKAMWGDNGYFALPILGWTGSVREWFLGAGCGLYVLYALTVEGFTVAGIPVEEVFAFVTS